LEVKKVVKRKDFQEFVDIFGQRYSEILGIRVSEGTDEEIFKWFLASILFGAPITEASVLRTYKCFQKYSALSPEKILKAGWDELVKILDEGGYTRYDFKTADKLLEVMENLTGKYGGSLALIHDAASGPRDLENRLKDLGKGIGDVTVSIFLRELRDVWEKTDPMPTSLEILAAIEIGILEESETPENALKKLKAFWAKNSVAGKSFANFETALVRLGKDVRKKRRR
jgi:endonuclease III